jgi:hypothetical protein
LLTERGLEADHTTIWRWVQRYGPELEQRMRRHLKPTNKSWRVDETYVRVKGRWCYLYRAIDSCGATIDFLLSALRDAEAAKRLFRKALSDPSASATPRHQHRSGADLRLGHRRYKEGRDTSPPLPAPTGAVPEQHPGTRPPSD